METTPRGVSPRILLEQIRNTVPFLLDGNDPAPYLVTLRETERSLTREAAPEAALSHEEYFRLCLSAHHATVGSFVPTDVDNQIRFRLWSPALPTETLEKMAKVIEESYGWDPRPASHRWLRAPSGRMLSGHRGEWFSTAAGAYGALRKKSEAAAQPIATLILNEVENEAEIFRELTKKRDGLGCLRASFLIAHNLGDLDRVFEMWNIPETDPLAQKVFKLGHKADGRYENLLHIAGILNKEYMANENHRHFALRAPRCLRRSADFLLPIGPFFDDWGRKLARHPLLSPEDVAEIVEALIDGYERLKEPKPVGYPRAIAGILDAFPGGMNRLLGYLPARVARTLKAGPLRAASSIPQRRMEDQWNQMALKHI